MSETLSIEQLQAQVDQVSLDLTDLKKESSDDIIKTKTADLQKKVNTTKDNINQRIDELKSLGETSHSAEIAKLENMLTVLKTSNTDLDNLKKDVVTTSAQTDSDTDNDTDTSKDETKDETKDKEDTKDKNRFKRQIDGFSDKTEEHHWWKNTARIAWGVGILALGIRWIKKLFGKKKDENVAATVTDKTWTETTLDDTWTETTPSATAQEKKKTSFGSKVWKVIKYGWIAVGWFFGLRWLIGKGGKDILDWTGIRKRPDAPDVSADDANNTITWLAAGMEYSTDNGKTYTAFDESNVPTFPGVKKILVRTAKTDTTPESKTKEISFTAADAGPTTPWYEAEYETLDAWKKAQYGTLETHVSTLYDDTMKSVNDKIRIPPLLVRKDASLSTWSSYASIMYMLDEHYGTMDKVLHDDYFSKVEKKADLVVDDIVEFLKKYQDNKIVGGMCTTIASRLESYLKKWGFDETSLKAKLKDDPNALAQLKVLIKKISVVRFFVSEKRKIYEQHLEQNDVDETGTTPSTLTDTFDGVRFVWASESDVSLYSTLKDNNLLDSKISTETQAGIDLNKAAQTLQKKIESTESTLDYSWKRWKIKYDYTNGELQSRDNTTEIEILPSGVSSFTTPTVQHVIDNMPESIKPKDYVFRIKDLPVRLTSADEAVWLANFINKMMYDYGSTFAEKLKNNASGDCLGRFNSYRGNFNKDVLYPGIYEAEHGRELWNPFHNATRVLSKSTLYENCPGWWDDEAEALVAYLNKRFKKLAG